VRGVRKTTTTTTTTRWLIGGESAREQAVTSYGAARTAFFFFRYLSERFSFDSTGTVHNDNNNVYIARVRRRV
jgi:hypothetical protein